MASDETLGTQLGLRLNADDLERLDRVARALAERLPGAKPNRSATARHAILRGLDSLEREFRIPAPKRKRRTKS